MINNTHIQWSPTPCPKSNTENKSLDRHKHNGSWYHTLPQKSLFVTQCTYHTPSETKIIGTTPTLTTDKHTKMHKTNCRMCKHTTQQIVLFPLQTGKQWSIIIITQHPKQHTNKIKHYTINNHITTAHLQTYNNNSHTHHTMTNTLIPGNKSPQTQNSPERYWNLHTPHQLHISISPTPQYFQLENNSQHLLWHITHQPNATIHSYMPHSPHLHHTPHTQATTQYPHNTSQTHTRWPRPITPDHATSQCIPPHRNIFTSMRT